MPEAIPSYFLLDTYLKRYLRLFIRLFFPDASQGQAATRLPAVGQLSQPSLWGASRDEAWPSPPAPLTPHKEETVPMAERDEIPLSELERYKSRAWEYQWAVSKQEWYEWYTCDVEIFLLFLLIMSQSLSFFFFSVFSSYVDVEVLVYRGERTAMIPPLD